MRVVLSASRSKYSQIKGMGRGLHGDEHGLTQRLRLIHLINPHPRSAYFWTFLTMLHRLLHRNFDNEFGGKPSACFTKQLTVMLFSHDLVANC